MAAYAQFFRSIFDLPGWSSNPRISLLDPLRKFENAPGFGWAIWGVPNEGRLPIPARGQIEEWVRVPVGSFLLSVTAGSTQPEGFRYVIQEQDTGVMLMSSPCWSPASTGTGRRQHVLPDPYCVTGALLVKLNNLSILDNDCQLGLQFAVPLPNQR